MISVTCFFFLIFYFRTEAAAYEIYKNNVKTKQNKKNNIEIQLIRNDIITYHLLRVSHIKWETRKRYNRNTTLAKKRTILEIRGEKNAVPCVISCSFTSDQRRARSDLRLSTIFALH